MKYIFSLLVIITVLVVGALPPATSTAQQSLPKGDIVFVIDESGSMEEDQNEVQAQVSYIANQLGTAIDFQFGLVGFGFGCSDISTVWDTNYGGWVAICNEGGWPRVHSTLTNDAPAFASSFNKLEAYGGLEPGFDAVMLAMDEKMGFRPDAGTCVVMITDEESGGDEYTREQTIATLRDRNALFFGITNQSGVPSTIIPGGILLPLNSPTQYGPLEGSLAAETGGDVFNILDFRQDSAPVLDAVLEKCIRHIETGRIEVNNQVYWNGSSVQDDQTFEVCVTGPSLAQPACQETPAEGGSLIWNELEPGDYTITETPPGDMWEVSGVPTKVNVQRSGITTAEVINSRIDDQTADSPWSFACKARSIDISAIGVVGNSAPSFTIPQSTSSMVQIGGTGFHASHPDEVTFHFADGSTKVISSPTALLNTPPAIQPVGMMAYTFETLTMPGNVTADVSGDDDKTANSLVSYTVVPTNTLASGVVTTTLRYTWGGDNGIGAVGPAQLTLALPEALSKQSDVSIKVAIMDKEPQTPTDQRIALVRAETGDGHSLVSDEVTITNPDEERVNVVPLTLTDVPTGTKDIRIAVISPLTAVGKSQWKNPAAGDSVVLLGASAWYKDLCDQESPTIPSGDEENERPLVQSTVVTTSITPEEGGTLTSGPVSITFPSDAVTTTMTLTYGEISEPPQEVLGDLKALAHFTLQASTATGEQMTEFLQDYTISVDYHDSALADTVANVDELTLVLAFFNEANDQWTLVPATVDKANQRIVATLNHFTEFALFGEFMPAEAATESAVSDDTANNSEEATGEQPEEEPTLPLSNPDGIAETTPQPVSEVVTTITPNPTQETTQNDDSGKTEQQPSPVAEEPHPTAQPAQPTDEGTETDDIDNTKEVNNPSPEETRTVVAEETPTPSVDDTITSDEEDTTDMLEDESIYNLFLPIIQR